MKITITYSLALIGLVLSLGACGKQSASTQNLSFCAAAVTVAASEGDYPKAIASINGEVKKFCRKDADGTIEPWRGGYRSVASPSCGFWGDNGQLSSDISLALTANEVDCQ